MWYKETDYPGINADTRSITIAFANLLQKMDSEYQPQPSELYDLLTSDDPTIDWWSVAEYVDDMEINEVRAEESLEWPPSSNAIVKFRRVDEAAAGVVDHYCLVADHHARSIVDSLDGIIKSAATYGEIVGWASYISIVPDPEFDAYEARILAEAGTEPNTYILHGDETIWDAARKTSFKVDELVKLNNIDDPRTVKAGYKLHLPVREAKARNEVRYEVLDEPIPMHISKPGGTKKYTFGNATKWDDIEQTGRVHAENSNHMIHAIAHVTLEKEDITAAYYMDRIDLGNYIVTGRPQFMTGFNHSHMAEGHVLPTELTAPKEEIIEAINEAAEVVETLRKGGDIKPAVMDVMLENAAPAAPQQAQAEDYRATLQPLKDDESPTVFMAEENITVHEIARRRPARLLAKGQRVKMTHTFEKDNVLYGLPAGTKDSPFWYGIPMDKVISEEELYNFDIPLSERIALRSRLTTQERGVVVLSKALSQGTRLRVWLKNKKQGVQ